MSTKTKLRNEIQTFKLYLFGKDVLSIINLYYLEGFDEWSILIKNLNQEYRNIFRVFNNGTIVDTTSSSSLFNFRDKTDPYKKIYHFDLKHVPIMRGEINNTGIELDYKKYF